MAIGKQAEEGNKYVAHEEISSVQNYVTCFTHACQLELISIRDLFP